MPYQGDTGQYGLMPYSSLARKFESTNINEDPNQLYDYHRNTITDYRPDNPSLESDRIRYDNHSTERMAHRHTGSRSGLDPYMPDLFLGLTERDPRGTALGPDMKLARNHTLARGKFANFRDDSDHSIMESVVPDYEIINKIRASYQDVRDRLKIFSTAKGNYPAARNFKGAADSRRSKAVNPEDCLYNDLCEQEMYGMKQPVYDPKSLLSPLDQDGYNSELMYIDPHHDPEDHEDATIFMSNHKPIGSRVTSDHEFKVANYGLNRLRQNLDNPEHKRFSTTDILAPVMFQDQRVSKGLALLMQNIVNERARKQSYFGGTIDFNESWDARRNNKSISGNRRGGASENYSTHSQTIQKILNSEVTKNRVRTGRQNKWGDQQSAGGRNSAYSQSVAEKMVQAVNSKYRVDKDLRSTADKVEASDYRINLTLENVNKQKKIVDPDEVLLQKRKTHETREFTNSKSVANYGQRIKPITGGAENFYHGNPTQAFSQSDLWGNKKQLGKASNNGVYIDNTLTDIDQEELGEFTRATGGGGMKKYMRPYMDEGEFSTGSMNDRS